MHLNENLIHIIFIDKMLVNCLVCLGDINLFDKEVSILNCGHFFHDNCLKNWLNQQMNCPECRATVTRGNFARNIFPKINNETLNQWKSLKKENVFLEMENLSLKDS